MEKIEAGYVAFNGHVFTQGEADAYNRECEYAERFPLANVFLMDEQKLHDEIIKYIRENYVFDAKDTKIKWYLEESGQ